MSLKFDGKSNWKAFYAKFSRYAEVSEGKCRDQLCWCLDGKASEYYALLVERNQDMAYMDLIRKLEKRFGVRELPETAQVQFNNARVCLVLPLLSLIKGLVCSLLHPPPVFLEGE
jgi:hypothetical protein